ncbi:class I SAM-dependent methyltransferase [Candidatus Accumulibacter aalborgensis]|nr:class I SAM-dependent methyltransferase [Candidatus Accumulibacter aalborgensis]
MSIPGLDAWLQTPQGRYVMAWEQARIDAAVADLFGYNAIQLGLPQCDLLAQNRIPLRQVAHDSGNVDVICDLRQIPFAAHSIDVVVMAHVLEFHAEPHQILREVERVLIPEGEVLITGFNPLSIWGLRRRLPNCPRDFPWNGHYLSLLRLKDWLQLLGFEVDRVSFGCYAPPCRHERWLKRWRFMEASGDRWWSFAGGVYLVRAIKRVHSMRLILPNWKQQTSRRKALSVVSQKEMEDHER